MYDFDHFRVKSSIGHGAQSFHISAVKVESSSVSQGGYPLVIKTLGSSISLTQSARLWIALHL